MKASASVSRVLMAAMVVGTLFVSTLHPAEAARGRAGLIPAAAKKTGNLIKDPGAESAMGSTDGSPVTIPNWSSDGVATVVKYGSPGGYPDANTPGAPQRGTNFFAGGLNTFGVYPLTTELQQTIQLAKYKTAIGTGHVTFTLKAWLGGYATDADNAVVKVEFDDANQMDVGEATLGPVTKAQRHNQTKFLLRTINGTLYKTARTAFVTIDFTGVNGVDIDGYADNLSLILTGV
jgi:hypothetical protein